MKTRLIAAGLLLAALCAPSFAGGKKESAYADKLAKILGEKKLTVATSPEFAPWEFIDPDKSGQDKYAGFDMAFARYIAKELGVELEIQAMDFQAVQAAVTQGKVDLGISGFAYTEERAESMELSDYYNVETRMRQGILVNRGSEHEYASAESFAGKTLAIQNASLQYNLAAKQLPADIKIELVTSLNDAVMMLITHKVDGFVCSEDNGDAFARNYPDIAMSDFWFNYSSEGNVVAMTKGETALAARINEIIKKTNAEHLFIGWREEAVARAEQLGIKTN